VFKNNKYYPLAVQFLRYVAVGGVAFIIDFLVLTGALDLGLHYILATVVAFIAGLLVNYCLCVLWVWSGTQARSFKDVFIFALIGVGGLLLTVALMWLAVDVLLWDVRISKIIIAILVLLWNFGLRRIFVFFK
jgi:putative flippase GtrA